MMTTADAPGATRDQLSLFIEGPGGDCMNTLRRQLDPIQASLIPAHVTLCREDELDGLTPEVIATRLAGAAPVSLCFGVPERFGGHGILLPCIAGQVEFDALRRRALAQPTVRQQSAHVTLAHPRNPRSAGNHLPAMDTRLIAAFAAVRWIRQVGTSPWQTLMRVALAGPPQASRC